MRTPTEEPPVEPAGPQWAAAPDWFGSHPEPHRDRYDAPHQSPHASGQQRTGTYGRPDGPIGEPQHQPTYTWPERPQRSASWPGGADTYDPGYPPGEPATAGWPTGPGPALPSETGHGDVAVGKFDAPAERPPLPGRHEVRSSVRHPLKLAIYGLVLGGLVAGTVAWASMDKSVTLTVDGEARAMHTYAGSVQGVLSDAKVAVAEHDILAPGLDAPVKDGTEIVLRRGRVLKLTVDGQTRNVWVTATSMDEALTQVGFREDGLWLSASRSKRLGLDGGSIEVRTPKTVTVAADGRTRRMVSTVATVGDLLANAKVKVGATDRVSQLANAFLTDGMTITITRVKLVKQVEQAVVKYKVITKKDPTKPAGTEEVQTTGVDGLQEVTYQATYINGKLTKRKVVSTRVLTKVVNEVVVKGTKQPAPGEDGPIPSTGGLNWAALADCESSGNPRALNPAGPYYGLYQFDLGTWQSNGGTGIPTDASPAEQTRVANNLYQARGRSPWPVCGQYL